MRTLQIQNGYQGPNGGWKCIEKGLTLGFRHFRQIRFFFKAAVPWETLTTKGKKERKKEKRMVHLGRCQPTNWPATDCNTNARAERIKIDEYVTKTFLPAFAHERRLSVLKKLMHWKVLARASALPSVAIQTVNWQWCMLTAIFTHLCPLFFLFPFLRRQCFSW